MSARRERLRRYTTWTADDLKEFNASLDEQRVLDERDWKTSLSDRPVLDMGAHFRHTADPDATILDG